MQVAIKYNEDKFLVQKRAANTDMTHIQIQWNPVDEEWRTCYRACRRPSLFMDPAYAAYVRGARHQETLRGLVTAGSSDSDGDENAVGVVQVQRLSLFFGALDFVILDRGPAWIDGYGGPDEQAGFWAAVSKAFPRRIGRLRRILPEWPQEGKNENSETLAGLGFRRTPYPGYQTLWLGLALDLEDLRAGLHQKWRNQLNKAERQKLKIVAGDPADAGQLLWFCRVYGLHRAKLRYRGPASAELMRLAAAFAAGDQALMLRAELDGKPVGAILVLCHGRAATYQAAWTTARGRAHCAGYRMLWEAVRALKERGTIDDFDLGGIYDGDANADALRRFKTRTGAEPVCLPGQFR